MRQTKLTKLSGFKVVDSTTISLGFKRYQWTKFRKTKAGIKIHLRLEFIDDPTVIPEKFVVTPAGNNDCTQLEVLVDEKDVM